MSEGDINHIRELLYYRLARSHEALEEAKVLVEAKHLNTSVNRLYYACFYAVTALLLTKGLSSPKHTGIRSLFNRHFISTGLVPKEQGQLYNDLFESRQEADYRDFHKVEPSLVINMLTEVERFIDLIANMVSAHIDSLS